MLETIIIIAVIGMYLLFTFALFLVIAIMGLLVIGGGSAIALALAGLMEPEENRWVICAYCEETYDRDDHAYHRCL